MAKSYNQKVKILYLEKMLRESGEDRVVTMQEILSKLLEFGISAERKSIYDDIEALRSFGMDVKFRRGRPGGYYLAGQTAQHNAAGDEEPARDTGAEQGTQTAAHDNGAEQGMQTQSRHTAERETRPMAGQNVGGVAPKAEDAQALEVEWNLQKEAGSGRQIKLLCDNSVRKKVEACLGKKAQYKEKGLGYFTVAVGISEGPQFYGWLTSMGSKVHILKPKKTAQGYREYLKGIAKEYKGV